MIYELHRPCGFEEIYEKYYDRVYKYAFTLLLNKENAEDVTSETFLAAYANFGSYDETKASVATWLTRIAHNRAVNLMRSAEYSRRTELPENYEYPDPSDHIGQIEASDTVLRLYARLRPDERELLNMRCVMELKDREIAQLTGVPEKTVNKRYQRLLAKCRSLLDSG